MQHFIFALFILGAVSVSAKEKFVEIAEGGTLEFLPAAKVLFTSEMPISVEDMQHNLKIALAEVGSYEVRSEKYQVLTVVSSVNPEDQMGISTEFFVQRFLMRKSDLFELSPSRISTLDRAAPASEVEAAILKHLKKNLKRTKLELNQFTQLVSKIEFKPAHLKLSEIEFNSQKNLTETKLDKTILGYVPGGVPYYVQTVDGLRAKYIMDEDLGFSEGGRKYECNEYEKRGIGSLIIAKSGVDLVSLKKKNLRVGELYRNKKSDEIRAYIQNYMSTFEAAKKDLEDNSGGPRKFQTMPKKLTARDIIALNPIIYIKDSASRAYRCEYLELLKELDNVFAEPIVYFYPEVPSVLSYKIHPSVRLTEVLPKDQANAWHFTAYPNGSLQFSGEKMKRRYLFWEGRGELFPTLPTSGVLLQAPEVESFLIDQLEKFGLSQKESEDFRAYWVPILMRTPFALIDFLVQEEVDVYVPIQVSKPITRGIRVYINHRPLKSPNISYKEKVFPLIQRPKSNFFVEWGGVVWGKGIRFL